MCSRASRTTRMARPTTSTRSVLLPKYLKLLEVQRFGISFQSRERDGTVRHHLVLGIYTEGKYGACGISRNSRLMNKTMRFNQLIDLLRDFKQAYEDCGHTVEYITLSRPISHQAYANPQVVWQYIKINCNDWDHVAECCEQYHSKLVADNDAAWKDSVSADSTEAESPMKSNADSPIHKFDRSPSPAPVPQRSLSTSAPRRAAAAEQSKRSASQHPRGRDPTARKAPSAALHNEKASDVEKDKVKDKEKDREKPKESRDRDRDRDREKEKEKEKEKDRPERIRKPGVPLHVRCLRAVAAAMAIVATAVASEANTKLAQETRRPSSVRSRSTPSRLQLPDGERMQRSASTSSFSLSHSWPSPKFPTCIGGRPSAANLLDQAVRLSLPASPAAGRNESFATTTVADPAPPAPPSLPSSPSSDKPKDAPGSPVLSPRQSLLPRYLQRLQGLDTKGERIVSPTGRSPSSRPASPAIRKDKQATAPVSSPALLSQPVHLRSRSSQSRAPCQKSPQICTEPTNKAEPAEEKAVPSSSSRQPSRRRLHFPTVEVPEDEPASAEAPAPPPSTDAVVPPSPNPNSTETERPQLIVHEQPSPAKTGMSYLQWRAGKTPQGLLFAKEHEDRISCVMEEREAWLPLIEGILGHWYNLFWTQGTRAATFISGAKATWLEAESGDSAVGRLRRELQVALCQPILSSAFSAVPVDDWEISGCADSGDASPNRRNYGTLVHVHVPQHSDRRDVTVHDLTSPLQWYLRHTAKSTCPIFVSPPFELRRRDRLAGIRNRQAPLMLDVHFHTAVEVEHLYCLCYARLVELHGVARGGQPIFLRANPHHAHKHLVHFDLRQPRSSLVLQSPLRLRFFPPYLTPPSPAALPNVSKSSETPAAPSQLVSSASQPQPSSAHDRSSGTHLPRLTPRVAPAPVSPENGEASGLGGSKGLESSVEHLPPCEGSLAYNYLLLHSLHFFLAIPGSDAAPGLSVVVPAPVADSPNAADAS
eukprot:TRINITY_DN7851_c0_g1_i2.p1 TRINITY_DN7851_c0_g1~~TRINITY_DN7851_c0_g1_i2.p1  ORF type:complete len:991 (+),score=87.00 TRINITY_DN7851_c0_g1_i2:128-3100(+)